MGEERITYEELNTFSNCIANLLTSTGIVQGKIINVIIPPSIQLIAAVLAVFKSNAIYLPIDPEFLQTASADI